MAIIIIQKFKSLNDFLVSKLLLEVFTYLYTWYIYFYPSRYFFLLGYAAMSMSHLFGRRDEEEEGVEVESFEVTDWDLANEFNPDRRRFRQTKEQATYGIWAERDSDEDERPSFGGKK